jgi:hypothetical protein
MTYDTAFRFQQAVDPSALSTLSSAVHGLSAAIEDCRRSGNAAETDPAVLMLARHLGAVATANGRSDAALRQDCMAAISDLRHKPMLVTLAYRGVAYDADAKKAFHSEARKALSRLAEALGFERSEFDIRSSPGGIAVSGEIILHCDELYVTVSCGGFSQNGEIMYRRCNGRRDYSGMRNHYAGIRELTNAGVFAARLCRDLGLAVPVSDDRLVV